MHWICLVFLPFLFTACSSPKKQLMERIQQQALHLSLQTEPPTLDPRKAIDTASLNVIKLCFEGLMDVDETGEPIPALAERVEVAKDMTTYTFYLRSALWSDGTPITAHDVEHTWKTLLSPSFPCPFASDLYVLKQGQEAKMGRCSLDAVGVQALDERTLQVTLDHPVPYFLALVSSRSFPVVPAHIVTAFPEWANNFGPQFICNGPFLLTRWRHNTQIDLSKNPTYWNADQIRLNTISLPIIEDENTTLSLFESKELDWVGSPLTSLPLDAIASLKQRNALTIHPIAGVYYYLFNTKQFPFNNAHIRRALSFALNRQDLVDNVLQTDQLPAMAMIPPGMWKLNGGIFLDADIAEAKKELELGLKELGITKAQFPSVDLSYNTNSGHHKIAQAIQGQWLKALGIKVTLSNMEWKVFLDELRHHQFAIARMGGLAGYNDPMTFFELYKYLASSDNYTQWTDPRFTALLDASDRIANKEQRVDILKQAETILIEAMPVIPIYFYTGAYLKSPNLKGIREDALGGIDFRYAHLEAP